MNRIFCPITSYQKQYQSGTECMEEICAFWDEKREQCCIKTMALAAAADPLDSVREQAMYVPARPTTGAKPQDFYYNSERTAEVDLADQYIFNGGL